MLNVQMSADQCPVFRVQGEFLVNTIHPCSIWIRVDPIGQYPNPTSKDFITKWMIDARSLVSKWLNSRSLNHEECHIWAIRSEQSFQGMKDPRDCLVGGWEGWAASCVVFICCNGGEDGHFCGIIIPSLHRAHTQTPSDNFPNWKYLHHYEYFSQETGESLLYPQQVHLPIV